MPRGDRMGPSGEGPKTGRGMGYCSGNDHPGYMSSLPNWGGRYGKRFRSGPGFGRGPGFGFWRSHGNTYHRDIADVSEKTLIENEIRILKDQMCALEKRLSETNEE